MNHRDAEKHLVDVAEGVLDGKLLEDLTSHIEGCSDCQSWLTAFRFLASSADARADGEHPSSQLIALCAVRAEEQFELDRSDLRQHLECCQRCRDEIDLLRAALNQARPVVELAASSRNLTSARTGWCEGCCVRVSSASRSVHCWAPSPGSLMDRKNAGRQLPRRRWQGRNPQYRSFRKQCLLRPRSMASGSLSLTAISRSSKPESTREQSSSYMPAARWPLETASRSVLGLAWLSS